MSDQSNYNNKIKVIKYNMVLKDPESILRKKFGNDLILVQWNSESLIKVNENYGSTILKIDAVVKRNNESKKHMLNMVAKLMPSTEFQRTIFESNFSFKKEIFFFEDLVPTYRKIYGDKFNFVPDYFGSRLSMIPDSKEVDEDAVLLMKNLTMEGYYTADRLKGIDFDHLKVAVTALAKFHAIGLSLKHKKPSCISKFKKYSAPLKMDPKTLRPFVEEILSVIELDSKMKNYFNLIKTLDKLEHLTDDRLQIILELEDPWACIVHRDLWSNNILFHKNDEGKVDDVKIIDFQTYCISSPMTDLVFFLCLSCKLPLFEIFDEMVEIYRKEARKVIKELRCDLNLFSKIRFQEKLKDDAVSELYHVLRMTKVVTLEGDKDIEKSPVNDSCIQRLRCIIGLYINKNWI